MTGRVPIAIGARTVRAARMRSARSSRMEPPLPAAPMRPSSRVTPGSGSLPPPSARTWTADRRPAGSPISGSTSTRCWPVTQSARPMRLERPDGRVCSRPARSPISWSGTGIRSRHAGAICWRSPSARPSSAASSSTIPSEEQDPPVRTKIVATVGPATRSRDKIHALAELGVDVVRINFAHGTHEEHAQIVEWTREASEVTGRPIAILADLGGPKIRSGSLASSIKLTDQMRVVLAPEASATPDEIPTTYEGLANDVKAGNRVLLDDGLLELNVDEVVGDRVYCTVMRGGVL